MEGKINVLLTSKSMGPTGNVIGSFRCQAPGCSWAKEGVSRSATRHVKNVHPDGGGCNIYQPRDLVAWETEKRAKNVERSRRHYHKKKQEHRQAGGKNEVRAGASQRSTVCATAPLTPATQQSLSDHRRRQGAALAVLLLVEGGQRVGVSDVWSFGKGSGAV